MELPRLPRFIRIYILSFLPLREFQKLYQSETEKKFDHQSTYAERYLTRYGTQFPKIHMTTFDSEEHQYLFCAVWFHGEVGFNSHLFYSTKQCMRVAIAEKDLELIKYFKARYPLFLGFISDETDQAIEIGDIKVLEALYSGPDFKHFKENVKISDLKVFNLVKNNQTELLYQIHKECPLEELDSYTSVSFDDMIKSKDFETIRCRIVHRMCIICGLISSRKPTKIRKAREILIRYWNNLLRPDYRESYESHCKWYILRSIAQLDAVEYLVAFWRTFVFRKDDDKIDYIQCIFILSSAAAVNCLKWIANDENSNFFSKLSGDFGYSIEGDDLLFLQLSSPNDPRWKETLTILVEHLDDWRKSSIFIVLTAFIGDQRLLETDLNYIDSLYLVGIKHWDLIGRWLINANPSYDKINLAIPLNNESFQAYLKYRFSIHWFCFSDYINLDYPNWEKLITDIPKGRLSVGELESLAFSVPTHYLSSLLFDGIDRPTNMDFPTFLTYPIMFSNLQEAIESGNFEYLNYALKSKSTRWPVRFFVEKISEEMIQFLRDNSIKYIYQYVGSRDIREISKEELKEVISEKREQIKELTKLRHKQNSVTEDIAFLEEEIQELKEMITEMK